MNLFGQRLISVFYHNRRQCLAGVCLIRSRYRTLREGLLLHVSGIRIEIVTNAFNHGRFRYVIIAPVVPCTNDFVVRIGFVLKRSTKQDAVGIEFEVS